jgi:hypothetical protein
MDILKNIAIGLLVIVVFVGGLWTGFYAWEEYPLFRTICGWTFAIIAILLLSYLIGFAITDIKN